MPKDCKSPTGLAPVWDQGEAALPSPNLTHEARGLGVHSPRTPGPANAVAP